MALAGAASSPETAPLVPEELRETRALILCPPTLVENWLKEIARWTPKKSGVAEGVLGPVSSIAASDRKGSAGRSVAIHRWSHVGGVLVMGTALFRQMGKDALSLRAAASSSSKSSRQGAAHTDFDTLCDFPNVVVVDEAHEGGLKTENSLMFKVFG